MGLLEPDLGSNLNKTIPEYYIHQAQFVIAAFSMLSNNNNSYLITADLHHTIVVLDNNNLNKRNVGNLVIDNINESKVSSHKNVNHYYNNLSKYIITLIIICVKLSNMVF